MVYRLCAGPAVSGGVYVQVSALLCPTSSSQTTRSDLAPILPCIDPLSGLLYVKLNRTRSFNP